jgi:hypothetical protein
MIRNAGQVSNPKDKSPDKNAPPKGRTGPPAPLAKRTKARNPKRPKTGADLWQSDAWPH